MAESNRATICSRHRPSLCALLSLTLCFFFAIFGGMQVEAKLASPLKNDSGDDSGIVIIASDARSASTEMAEGIARHPCAVSFNEAMVMGPDVPIGYTRYNRPAKRSFRDRHQFIDKHLQWSFKSRRHTVLETAQSVRQHYCEHRSKELNAICGDSCVVVFKMHAKAFLKKKGRYAFIHSSKEVYTIVSERDTAQKYCSLQKAHHLHYYAHTPEQHNLTTRAFAKGVSLSEEEAERERERESEFVCEPEKMTRFFKYKKSVDAYYKIIRDGIAASGKVVDKTAMEINFPEYVSDPEAAHQTMWDFLGLPSVSHEWWDNDQSCHVEWCHKIHYPCCALHCANDGSTDCT